MRKTAQKKDPDAKPKRRPGKPRTITGPLAELADKMNGRDHLAEAMGVHIDTITRWAAGRMAMSGAARKLMLILCEQHGIKVKANFGSM